MTREIRALRREPLEAGRAPIEVALAELRALARDGRSACTNALTNALLEIQIAALERGDRREAWARLDEVRARLHGEGAPDLLHDRLAAALYNTHQGGLLLNDEPMRLAALDELRVRARTDPSASACRVALAEILADRQLELCRRGDATAAHAQHSRRLQLELRGLYAADPSVHVARERARGLYAQLLSSQGDSFVLLAAQREMLERPKLRRDQALRLSMAQSLVIAHALALQSEEDEELARTLGDEMRALTLGPDSGIIAGLPLTPPQTTLLRAFAKLLFDAAVMGLGAPLEFDIDRGGTPPSRALAQLRVVVDRHPMDLGLRALLMGALCRIQRNALEGRLSEVAEALQAEADALLESHPLTDLPPDNDHRRPDPDAEPSPRFAPPQTQSPDARALVLNLRLDHLNMLAATHASAGDSGDQPRSALLLSRARNLVTLAGGPVIMLEVFGQMLVNAHVDARDLSRLRADIDPSPEHEQGHEPEFADTRPLRGALLDELRELADRHLHSLNLQQHLATALFNAHIWATHSAASIQAEALLEELEELYSDQPGALELRLRLVMALVNHHGEALERGDYPCASAALERLGVLVPPTELDDHLCVQLAMALGNALAHGDEPERERDVASVSARLRALAARPDASDMLTALVLDVLSERATTRH